MRKQYTVYLDEDLQIEARKRSLDLKLKFNEYVMSVLRHELDTEFLTKKSEAEIDK